MYYNDIMKHDTITSFLVTPARLFMDRFRYVYKFTILGIIFIVPLLVSAYLLVSDANNHAEIHRQQFIGVQHIYNIQLLLRDVQQHRGITATLIAGDAKFGDRRKVLQGDIAHDITVVKNYYDSTYGKMSEITEDARYEHIAEEFQNVIFGWDDIIDRLSSFQTPEESYRAHTVYVNNILSLIKDVGDISGLFTEEMLINRYLAEMSISTLPEMSEHIGESRAYGLSIPQREMITDAEKYQFTIFSSLIKKYIEDLDRESNIVFRERPEMESTLAPGIHESTIALSSLLDMYQKEFINKKEREISNDAYWDVSTKAVDSVLGISNTLITMFAVTTNTRVDEIVRERNIIIGLSSGALFLAIYFLVGFYMGVRHTLMTILQTTDTMLRDGVYRRPIPVITNDELGDIARSFNKIINALGSANSTLVRVNSNLSESIAKKKKAEEELRVRVEEVDKFNRLMIGRELKMIELKEEVLKLKEALGEKGGGS